MMRVMLRRVEERAGVHPPLLPVGTLVKVAPPHLACFRWSGGFFFLVATRSGRTTEHEHT